MTGVLRAHKPLAEAVMSRDLTQDNLIDENRPNEGKKNTAWIIPEAERSSTCLLLPLRISRFPDAQ